MDDISPTQPHGAFRPYGLFSLALSLVGASVIAVLTLALTLVLTAAVVYLLSGQPYLHALITVGLVMIQPSQLGGLTTGIFLSACAIFLAGIVGLWAMARLRAGRAWPLLLAWTPFRADRVYRRLLLAAMAYGLGASLALGDLNLVSKIWFVMPESPLAVVAHFALGVILWPLFDELLFRGWIYTALRARFGFAAALWTTAILFALANALLFALAHWDPTHLYALAILLLGLVLGYVRERTGSVRATTLVHMIYTLSEFALTFLGNV